VKVRIHYPLGPQGPRGPRGLPAAPAGSELLLRCDADWETDLAPQRVDRRRSRFEFELADADFRYFKPVLREDGRVRWAQGENVLAVRGKQAKDVFPHFDPDSSCHVCDVHHVPSSFEARGYDLRVFLPQGYDENELERYPVLYMQDGQNLFFPDEAFGGKHWRIQETLELLARMNLVRKVIVVGVYPRDRMREYTEPGCASYARFLAQELVPWVDAHYRTLAGPAGRALLGSSLGGVVSFFTGWEHPDVFGNVGAMSSTFGYENTLLARVAREKKRALRIYLDSGYPRDNYEVTRSMRAALEARGWRRGEDLHYVAFPEGRHDEDSWAMRVHLPFQFFFGE
jgi:predicted alpha/beta superfamily hydrolase